MITVIGVRFRNTGKIYYFDPGETEIHQGMSVIVETSRGIEMGMVMQANQEVEDESVVQPLKPVIRIAETADFDIIRENKSKEKEAYKICQEKIREHGLDMKLVDVEYTFDGNKVLFYFTADGRIDFRELVKDLASIFRTRIELRQIGVRDETKLLGGIGICGRSLCCHSYLSEFIPVSIKMAKEQNLSLNPTKISGVCGRLMCCLKNEEDTYEYLNAQLPKVGEMVTVTEEGLEGQVQAVNVLRQRVKILIRTGADDIELKEYPVEVLDFGPERKPPVARERSISLLPEGGEDEKREYQGEERPSRSRRGNRENARNEEKEPGGRNRNASGRGDSPRGERGRRDQNRKNERPEKQAKNDRDEMPAKNRRDEHAARGERSGREEKMTRNERPVREERAARGEKAGREEPAARNERAGRNERSARSERAGRNEKAAREDRAPRNENPVQSEGSGQQSKAPVTEQGAQGERPEQTEGRRRDGRKPYHRRTHWQPRNKSAAPKNGGNE